MTKASPQVIVKEEPKPVLMRMVTRGRRALGEDWSDVTVSWDEETGGYAVETTPTEAPADGQAIIVPTMGMQEAEMTDYIIGWQRKKAEERAANPQAPAYESMQEEIQAAWMDYMENKVQWFANRSQYGPGGHTQRGDR